MNLDDQLGGVLKTTTCHCTLRRGTSLNAHQEDVPGSNRSHRSGNQRPSVKTWVDAKHHQTTEGTA